MTILFDSAAAVNVDNVFFAQGILPPTTFVRTSDDQPSPADSLEWYMQDDDPSDPAEWSDEELEEMYQDWLTREGHGGFCGHA